MRRVIVVCAMVALLASGLVATVAQAETGPVLNFEGYTTGTVHNQDGWSSAGAAGQGNRLYDHQVAAQSLYSTFGSKSLRISNAVTSGSFGDMTFTKSLENEAGEPSAENGGMSGGVRQPHFAAQFDFASVTQAHQPGLIMSISPDRGDGARMSWIEISDQPTGMQVRFGDFQNGDFVYTVVAKDLDRNVPHTINIAMDFYEGPGNDVVTITVDGTYTHTGTSWEDYFREFENNPTRTVDSLLFRTAGTAAPNTQGNGFYFDNIQLHSGGFTIQSLTTLTTDVVDNVKIERTMLASLSNVARFMDTRPQVARLALLQYIAQVQVYRFLGVIPADDAQMLLAQAQNIAGSIR